MSYKGKAIKEVAHLFRNSIMQTVSLSERLNSATLVPLPPSKCKNDPAYDGRNFEMLKLMMPKGDIRELILPKTSREPQRESKNARIPEHLSAYFSPIDDKLQFPKPKEIWLFDDVLTRGNTFRAAHDFLRKTFAISPS